MSLPDLGAVPLEQLASVAMVGMARANQSGTARDRVFSEALLDRYFERLEEERYEAPYWFGGKFDIFLRGWTKPK